MKVIYIAGPYRGANNWEIKCNVHRAGQLALEVWKLGHVALCPHLNTADFQFALPDRSFLEGDLELLRRCDAVLLTDNWHQSAGAKAEVEFAIQHSIPTFSSVNALQHWLAPESSK